MFSFKKNRFSLMEHGATVMILVISWMGYWMADFVATIGRSRAFCRRRRRGGPSLDWAFTGEIIDSSW